MICFKRLSTRVIKRNMGLRAIGEKGGQVTIIRPCNVNVDELAAIISKRKDNKVKTGVRVTVTRTTWENDPSGYGGSEVDYDTTLEQEKVVLNTQYNDERMAALEKLAELGGPKVIRALVNISKSSWQSSGELRVNGKATQSFVAIIIDDMTFENKIEARRNEVILDLISKLTDEEVKGLFEGDIGETARFCIAFNKNYSPSYLEILKRLASISPDNIIDLFCKLYTIRSNWRSNRREDMEDHEKHIQELITKDVRDRAKLSSLSALHHRVKDSGLKKTIFDEISSRITVKDAVDIINKILEMDDDLLSLVLEHVFKNYDSNEIDLLNFTALINFMERYIQKLMDGRNPDLLIRKTYPKLSTAIDRFTAFAYRKLTAEKTLKEKGAVLFVTVHFNKIRNALMAVMNNSKRKAIPVGFLAIFDLIRSREIVQMLFAMARRDIDNGFDYYMKLAEIVLSLERQDLNESDLEDLKDIYRLSKKYKWDWMSRIFGPAGELEQRIDIVLSRIARHIEEIEPGSVTRKRTFWEWFTRKRPWATKRRRKGLEKIESTQKYIEDINRIDSKVPYLFKIKEKERNYRFDYNSIREAVSMNLKEILAIAEEEPEFDYFDILSNMGVVTSIVEARHEQSLKLIEAALKYKLSRPYIYSSDEKDIEKLINMIGEYGDKAGIGILEEAREFISQSKLRFMSKIKARRMIRKAIKKVSRHIIVQMK